jgi:C-5 cytosine-specific DNA methylase
MSYEIAGAPGLLDEVTPTLADGPLPKESRPSGVLVSPTCSTNEQAALGGMTFYEFFAGAGMVRLGLGPDWTCLLANDNNVEKATSYARNFNVHALKIDDVACLTAADLPGRAALGWGSFPCQELSLAGTRAGLEGEHSATFWDGA